MLRLLSIFFKTKGDRPGTAPKTTGMVTLRRRTASTAEGTFSLLFISGKSRGWRRLTGNLKRPRRKSRAASGISFANYHFMA